LWFKEYVIAVNTRLNQHESVSMCRIKKQKTNAMIGNRSNGNPTEREFMVEDSRKVLFLADHEHYC